MNLYFDKNVEARESAELPARNLVTREASLPQRRLSAARLRLARSSACSYLQFRSSPLPYHMPQRARAEHGVDRRA